MSHLPYKNPYTGEMMDYSFAKNVAIYNHIKNSHADEDTLIYEVCYSGLYHLHPCEQNQIVGEIVDWRARYVVCV
jgi:hypothetical protein